MASHLDKDDYIYDVDNLTELMASMGTELPESTGARPKKAKSKKTSTRSAGKSEARNSKKDPPPASSPETLLEIEKLKNDNLKLELEITKAQLEMAKLKGATPESPQTPKVVEQPLSLQAALTSTPATSTAPFRVIPTLEQLREKMKPGSTLPNNYVFSSKGTILYDSLELPDFVNGFLEFQKQQSDLSKPALMTHLQLLMERASTYTWSSVRSFHLAIATAIEQNRLSWSNSDAIREKSQTFFTHQDLRTASQARPSGTPRQQSQAGPQTPFQRSLNRSDRAQKESYCRDWNYTAKCSCSATATTYATNHRCRVCDSVEHPMLHCAKRKFPIPTVTTISSVDSSRD